ncbi:MAG: hypothetical protein AB7U29_10610 [Desulfobulbus sp.]
MNFWQWLAGGAASFLIGLIGGTWAARGVLDELKLKNVVQDMRLEALERDREAIRDMATNMAVVAALQVEMKDDVKEIFARLNLRVDDKPHETERRSDGGTRKFRAETASIYENGVPADRQGT